MAKLDARLELRLDNQTYERLERRAAAGGLSVAQLVRQAIARELAGEEHSWREQVVEKGLKLAVPLPQDPADLVRELDARYQTEAAVSPAPAPAVAAPGATSGRSSPVEQSSRPGRAGRPDRRG